MSSADSAPGNISTHISAGHRIGAWSKLGGNATCASFLGRHRVEVASSPPDIKHAPLLIAEQAAQSTSEADMTEREPAGWPTLKTPVWLGMLRASWSSMRGLSTSTSANSSRNPPRSSTRPPCPGRAVRSVRFVHPKSREVHSARRGSENAVPIRFWQSRKMHVDGKLRDLDLRGPAGVVGRTSASNTAGAPPDQPLVSRHRSPSAQKDSGAYQMHVGQNVFVVGVLLCGLQQDRQDA